MTGQVDPGDDAVQRLAKVAAYQRVVEKALNREIYRAAHDGGLSQRQISEIVGSLSQPTVQRILSRFADDPSLLERSPAEVIDGRQAGLIDDNTMMGDLLNRTYSVGHVPSINGVATDAYLPGDWDQIEVAYYGDRLSRQEFRRLMDRQRDTEQTRQGD
jgi:hypothetical protein